MKIYNLRQVNCFNGVLSLFKTKNSRCGVHLNKWTLMQSLHISELIGVKTVLLTDSDLFFPCVKKRELTKNVNFLSNYFCYSSFSAALKNLFIFSFNIFLLRSIYFSIFMLFSWSMSFF